MLDLLSALKGERERERAVQILIHDLGDLSYMIEKYSPNRALLAKSDKLIEQRVHRLRNPAPRRLASVAKRRDPAADQRCADARRRAPDLTPAQLTPAIGPRRARLRRRRDWCSPGASALTGWLAVSWPMNGGWIE